MLHQWGGYQGQAINYITEIYLRSTLVAMATKIRKFGNFNTKFVGQKHECCTKQGVINIAQFNGAIEIYSIPTRCYGNPSAVFEQKILLTIAWLCEKIRPRILYQTFFSG